VDALIILDEVQACEQTMTSLKYFAERAPQYHVVAVGSMLSVAMNREKFSMPILHDDDILTCIPTQYIAEYIEDLGYDGIKYCSIFNSKDLQYANFVIFNYSRCKPMKSNVYVIGEQVLRCEKHDSDNDDEADDENMLELIKKSYSD